MNNVIDNTTQLQLSIAGMTCASCVSHVEKALHKVAGVQQVSVNLATEKATIHTVGNVLTENLIAAVTAAGYDASVPAILSEKIPETSTSTHAT
ncbi:MAG: heavy-metal-associated domain-containing protein, partial [Glaciimonas sp.]|nr:heavy-metal-associated domain-containing protein [Glaciimonas sp.]